MEVFIITTYLLIGFLFFLWLDDETVPPDEGMMPSVVWVFCGLLWPITLCVMLYGVLDAYKNGRF